MKRLLITSAIVCAFISITAQANSPVQKAPQNVQNKVLTAQAQQAEYNKKLVTDFYNGVFQKHQVKAYADQYIGAEYIQHNPHVPNGKAPFVNYFSQYFKDHPQAKSVIKRSAAEGDLVYLHVHSQENPQDRGVAIVDIFRVKEGKIVEHWDVQQAIPAESANQNSMF
ncbi:MULTISPECIES: ester cyclase [Acinetobacter]|jgi:predicted SnoaL-like aldol condensation-catalyzing enzyme|uniref:Polyketide cyclase n=1 Tax=Acinetobacter chengduensis TaxID=2420890 RepID=A0ABX9TUR5_9GAMM|nr:MULTISPECIES: nuclear transport factor 2 family protein [Acinetobacter]MBI1452875.1 ester cyclase [Acinetobacter sp. FL51]RKG38623.1 polyketide cyclase [Acinetobacter sp. WCHAc060007]RLL21053.1 polyketide cyclase [Acinetobacter chengduensis]